MNIDGKNSKQNVSKLNLTIFKIKWAYSHVNK